MALAKNIKSGICDILILLGYFLPIFVVCPKILTYLSSAFLMGPRGDPGIYVWASAYVRDHIFSGTFSWFNAPIFFPFGLSLAYSDNFIFPGFLSYIISFFSDIEYLQYNIPLVLAFSLNGYFTYKLAKECGSSNLASILSGTAFQLLPYLSFNAGHVQLQWTFFIPAFFLSILRFSKRPDFIYACFPGAYVFGAFLTSVYYGVFLGLFAPLSVFILFYLGERNLKSWVLLLTVSSLWILFLYPFVEPYLKVREAFGGVDVATLRSFQLKAGYYIGVSSQNYIWGDLLSGFIRKEAALFPGVFSFVSLFLGSSLLFKESKKYIKFTLLICFVILTVITEVSFEGHLRSKSNIFSISSWLFLILSLVSLGKSKENSGLKLIFLVASTSLVISFGFFGSEKVTGGFEPLRFLYHLYPGFDGLRAISRIAIFTLLASSVFLSFIADRYISNKKFIIFLVALVALETNGNKWKAFPEPPVPGVISKLNEIMTSDEAVIMLPFFDQVKQNTYYPRYQVAYMRYGQKLPGRIFSGYSGKIPGPYVYGAKNFDSFPSMSSLDALSQYPELKYVIFIKKLASDAYRKRVSEGLNSGVIKKLYRDNKGNYVFKIKSQFNLSEATDKTIYMSPSELKRTLRFEVIYTGSKNTLTFRLKNAGENIISIPVEKQGKGFKVKVHIPKATHPVRAVELKYHSLIDKEESLILRKLELN